MDDPPIPAREGNQRRALLIGLAAGLLSGGTCVLYAVSYANLIFSGPLSAFIALGLGMALFGATMHALVLSLGSSWHGSVGGVSTEIVILGVVTGELASEVMPGADSTTLLATVVAVMVLASALLGIVYWTLGRARLGNIVRYIPHPVMGGFVAGIAWLLVVGAIELALGTNDSSDTLARISNWQEAVRWLPAVAVGVALVALEKQRHHYVYLIGILALMAVLIHGIAWVQGMDTTVLGEQGWLLGPFTTDAQWRPWLVFNLIEDVQWQHVLFALPGIATYIVTMTIGLLLVGASLELITRDDIALDRELRTAGLANLAAAAGSGFPGYHYIASSTMHHHLGVRDRRAGVVAAIVCATILFLGIDTLQLIPRMVAASLLLYMGLSLLRTWLVRSAFRLSRGDYVVVVTVFIVVVFAGLMEGVIVGLILGIAIFAFNYSRIDVVKRELTAGALRSRVARPASELKVLRGLGEGVAIFRLEGYIFFGTVNRLLERIRGRMAEPSQTLHSVVLDFRNVRGIDSSAATYFSRLTSLAGRYGFNFIVTSIAEPQWRTLQREGILEERRRITNAAASERREVLPPLDIRRVLCFASLDDALEWCEDRLLLEADFDVNSATERSLVDAHWALFSDSDVLKRFMEFASTRSFEPGEALIRQGESFKRLYFILSGTVDVSVVTSDGERVRLRNMGAGASVGEISMYTGTRATADVTAYTKTVAISLTRDALDRLRREAPEVHARLHETLAHTLATRLGDSTRLIDILLH